MNPIQIIEIELKIPESNLICKKISKQDLDPYTELQKKI